MNISLEYIKYDPNFVEEDEEEVYKKDIKD
jgi:hypothetical protein